MTPETINLIKDVTLGTGAILILLAGARGWWVYGWTHDRVVKERDRYLDLLLRANDQAETATGLGERMTQARQAAARRETR